MTEELGLSVTIDAELSRFERAMREAGRLVETSTSGMDRSTKRAAQSFKQLEGALDPAARAAARLERDTAKVQRALDLGAVSADRAAKVQKFLNDQYERSISRATGLSRAEQELADARQRGAAAMEEGLARRWEAMLEAEARAAQEAQAAQETLAQARKRAEAAMEEGALRRWEAALEAEAQAAREVAAATSAEEAALQRLRNALNPAAAATNRMEQEAQQLAHWLMQGKISAREHARAMEMLTARHMAVSNSMGMSSQAIAAGSKGMQRYGSVMQQAGYQVGDFAVQVASGQNAMVAMTQQGSQLLGVFGPWGAVLGAAGAVAGALAVGLTKTSDSTKDAESAADNYKASLEELVELEKEYNAELRKRQGLPALPGGTEAIEQRYQMALGRMRALEGQAGGLMAGPSGWMDSARAWWNARDKSPYEQAQAEFEAARIDRAIANDLAEATSKERVAKIIADLTEARRVEAEMLRLAEDERERTKAGIEAEKKVREDLLKAGAPEEVIKREGELARAHAETAVAADQAAKAEKKAADERERAAKKAEREAEALREKAREATASIDRQVAAYGIETEALGESERARYLALETMKAEEVARRGGIDLTNEQREAIEKEAGALYDLKEARKAQEEALREHKRAMEQYAREINRVAEDIAGDWSETLYDAIVLKDKKVSILDSFRDLFRRIGIEALKAQIVLPITTAIVGSVPGLFGINSPAGVANVAGSLAGVPGSGGGMLQQAGGLGSLFSSGGASSSLYNVGSWLATSQVGQALGMSVPGISGTASATMAQHISANGLGMSGANMTGLGASFAQGMSYSPWGILGGLGASLMGFNGSGNMLVDLGLGTAGSIGGAMAGSALGGAAYGSILGPVGAIAGAFLGQVIGSMFADEKIPYGTTGARVVNGQVTYPSNMTAVLDGFDLSPLKDGIGKFAEAANGLAQMTGTKLGDFSTRWTVGRGWDNFMVSTSDDFSDQDARVYAAKSLSGSTATQALRAMILGGLFEGMNADAMRAARRYTGDDAETLGTRVGFGQSFRDTTNAMLGRDQDPVVVLRKQVSAKVAEIDDFLKLTAETFGASGWHVDRANAAVKNMVKEMAGMKQPAEQLSTGEAAVKQIVDTFRELGPLFEKVGISAKQAAAAQQKALGDLRTGFDASIQDQILAIVDPQKLALRQLNQERDTILRDAKAVGGDIAEVTRLYELKRLEIIKQYSQQGLDVMRSAASERATAAVVDLQGYLKNLQFGDSSALTPEQQLRLATQQYNAVSGAARAGDILSVEGFQSAASTYLAELRDRFGSGAGYAQGFQRVVDDLSKIAALPPDRLTASAYKIEMRDQTQVLRSGFEALKSELQSLRRELSAIKAQPVRIAA